MKSASPSNENSLLSPSPLEGGGEGRPPASRRTRIVRRIVCALTLLAIAAFSLICLWWTPYRPSAMTQAIPVNADFVSTHSNLTARFDAIAHHPAAQSFLSQWPAGPRLPGVPPKWQRAFLRKLFERDVVFARIPATEETGQPAYVMTAWIGNYSPLLRWYLFLSPQSQARRIGTFVGYPIWTCPLPADFAGKSGNPTSLTFTFGDGVLLVCCAEQPNAIRQFLLTYDGQFPSLAVAKRHPALDRTTPDAGWLRFHSSGTTWRYTLAHISCTGLNAMVRLNPGGGEISAPLRQTLPLDQADRFLGALPVALASGYRGLLDRCLDLSPNAAWTHIPKVLFEQAGIAPDSPFLAALLTGEYSGGFGQEPFRLRVPVLVALARVSSPQAAQQGIARTLDELNLRYRLGFIVDPSPITVGGQPIYTLEATTAPKLAAIQPEDRPAFTCMGNWILLSSHAGCLRKLLARFQQIESGAIPPEAGAWRTALDTRNACGLLWINPREAKKIVQLGLSLTALNLRAPPSGGIDYSRRLVQSARRWLDAAPLWREALVWMEAPSSNEERFHIEMPE